MKVCYYWVQTIFLFIFFFVVLMSRSPLPEPEIEKANLQARVPEHNSQVFNLSNCSLSVAFLNKEITS